MLAGNEREASVELLAHLSTLDRRPSVYAAQGYGSLFSYCTQALWLSEDAACNRIEAARTCRRYPVILDLLASGEVSLTSVRLLGRHLTPADVPSSVRKLPAFRAMSPSSAPPAPAATGGSSEPTPVLAPSPATCVPTPRPIVRATAPERYRVQFTIGAEGHERLRRLQALLRREIPDGDPGVIVERALALLLEKVEKTKLGAAARGRGHDRLSAPGRITQSARATCREQ